MSDSRPGLFTPIQIGERTLRNRIVFLPHATGLGEEGMPSEGHAAYYARRAEGGVAMIISEATPVHVASLGRPTHVKGYDPRTVPHFRKIADAVHAKGAWMLAQISHRGLGAMPMFSGTAVWAPSPSRSPHTGEIAHALTLTDIKEVVAGFVQTARNLIDGGYDGAEVHATHGHLLNSFISAKLNWRTDAYGGPIENRMRLLLEVLEALRRLPLPILGIRIGQPFHGTGPDAEEAVKVIRAIEPYVDYISVTGGTQATKHLNMGDFYSPPGYMLELARQVKGMTKKPVITAGQLQDPDMAARVLAEGTADLLGMARGLICEPEWARKVEQKQADNIRKCIACNNCVERVDSGVAIGCLFNPRTGREAVLARLPTRETNKVAAKKVLVVGGGPAGMQAALRAAELGMRVTLAEAGGALGGQVPLAASIPGRDVFGRVIDFLQRGLAASHVEVRTGQRLNADAVAAAGYDGVIVATGSRFDALPANAAIAVPRFRAEEVVRNPQLPNGMNAGKKAGKKALVYIEDGMPAGPGAAEMLLARGVEVHIVINAAEVGLALPLGNRQMLMARLLALPIRWHFHSTLSGVSKAGEAVIQTRGEGERKVAGVDFVVHALSGTAETALLDDLIARGVTVVAAGDCVAPRNIFSAMREGHDAADQLAAQLSA
jgi:2,4-dienoyl-CoA reductase (NADPH2)